MSPEFRVDLLEVRFDRAAFLAVRAHCIFDLRLESGQRLLLRFELGRMLIDRWWLSPARASAESSRLRLLLQRIRNAAIRCLLLLPHSSPIRALPWRDASSHPATESLIRRVRSIRRPRDPGLRERTFDRRPQRACAASIHSQAARARTIARTRARCTCC